MARPQRRHELQRAKHLRPRNPHHSHKTRLYQHPDPITAQRPVQNDRHMWPYLHYRWKFQSPQHPPISTPLCQNWLQTQEKPLLNPIQVWGECNYWWSLSICLDKKEASRCQELRLKLEKPGKDNFQFAVWEWVHWLYWYSYLFWRLYLCLFGKSIWCQSAAESHFWRKSTLLCLPWKVYRGRKQNEQAFSGTGERKARSRFG